MEMPLNLEMVDAPLSWLNVYSYIWKHLDIGYVQGMCDLLAPLLVILDDGESTILVAIYFPFSLTFGVFFQLLMDQRRRVGALTFSLQLCPSFRGAGFQLFH